MSKEGDPLNSLRRDVGRQIDRLLEGGNEDRDGTEVNTYDAGIEVIKLWGARPNLGNYTGETREVKLLVSRNEQSRNPLAPIIFNKRIRRFVEERFPNIRDEGEIVHRSAGFYLKSGIFAQTRYEAYVLQLIGETDSTLFAYPTPRVERLRPRGFSGSQGWIKQEAGENVLKSYLEMLSKVGLVGDGE